jgi:UDP:flavonoid glycosyltransferase YjiC (YdhE family)
VTAALLAGVPLLIMPTQLEQLMSSRRVAQQMAAIVVMKNRPTGGKEDPSVGEPPKDEKAEKPVDYAGLIKQLLTDEKFRQGARAFAKKYERFSQAGQSRAIASRVEQLLQS